MGYSILFKWFSYCVSSVSIFIQERGINFTTILTHVSRQELMRDEPRHL